MESVTKNKSKKNICMGLLAHVDAGKTTLSESMLYLSGAIRKLGRVDNKDAYLDTYELERARGITIYSKQAIFTINETQITLLDTPGHVDFSAEMERTLQVLDYAVLVISGADGVQGHTKTLWRLLTMYQIPTFIFINKMDQAGTDKEALLYELKKQLEDECIDFSTLLCDDFYDALAMCDEALMHEFLEQRTISVDAIASAIRSRKVFPCYFGSALKLEGIEALMQDIVKYTKAPIYSEEFGAKVFKITRDEQGTRLTHMKITGGCLKIKYSLTNIQHDPSVSEEKVNQIRLYSGNKYELIDELSTGNICAVTGPKFTKPGEGLGTESASISPVLEPVLSYQIILPEGCDSQSILPKLLQIEEEEPELHIVWNEYLQEIQAQIMGEVQVEILKSLIFERFGIEVNFGVGTILYKETISDVVEGVGHFEPLRHYAEVHLLLEPLEAGSGLLFDSNCSEDELDRNWQRQVLTHLEEKSHKGVLTGAAITDMRITLVAGRAHKKHTEGGDFREATYRAVRQGLQVATSILLEPYYSFQLEVPEKMIGRAITDIEKMNGSSEIKHTDKGIAMLIGRAPVITMQNYQREVISYTKGEGRLFCSFVGYAPCHNTEEIIASIGYKSDCDIENPSGSVFCSHGSGFLVGWSEVTNHMHLGSYLLQKKGSLPESSLHATSIFTDEMWIDTKEIDQIISRTYYANIGNKTTWKKTKGMKESLPSNTASAKKNADPQEEFLLVDGYNIVFAWPELRELANVNMDGAKSKLMDLLCNYQAIRKCTLIIVFDAYRIIGHATELLEYHNIHVVYTKEAETADQYIEKFVHNHVEKYHITVATSDGLEQIIIRSKGSDLLSASDLKLEMQSAFEKNMQLFREKQETKKNYLFDSLPQETEQQLEAMRRNMD